MSLPCLGGGCLGGGLVALVLAVPLLFLGGDDIGAAATAAAPGPSSGGQVVAAGGVSCNAAVHCQPIPGELSDIPVGFFPDAFTSPAGECTSWAAALWPGHRGRGVTWTGDAWEWYANAAAQGYAVSTSPSPGAIAVFARGVTDVSAWGHVAVVLRVDAGEVLLTEMNVMGRFVVDQRPVSVGSPELVGFIPVPGDALP